MNDIVSMFWRGKVRPCRVVSIHPKRVNPYVRLEAPSGIRFTRSIEEVERAMEVVDE
jgi:hypothetical protein